MNPLVAQTTNEGDTAGCRCPHCRDAWADYMRPRQRAYRNRKKNEQ